ncbi:MAG: hypothetical protein AAF633_18625 [Chloroflexota bacterium]
MLVLPISSQLYQEFNELAQSSRMVFMVGLPGVGKSLLIQQLALLARQVGREVHLLQWDSARKAFEIPAVLDKYPEINGVTDPIIRKGVGGWARAAIAAWHAAHSDDSAILISEVPMIGSRLIELAEVHEDEAEALLASDLAQFVTPVPSWEVRAVIEKAREASIAKPQHELEKQDAPPNVLRELWTEVNNLARRMKLTKARPDAEYNPYIYGGVFEAILQHRHSRVLLVDQVLKPKQSVYELDIATSVLQASEDEVEKIITDLEKRYTRAEIVEDVITWHKLITANPKLPDPGPALHLPLPNSLRSVVAETILSETQAAALNELIALPFEAPPAELAAGIETALAAFEAGLPTEATPSTAKKFDIFDGYFNVVRLAENNGLVHIVGLLHAYRNILFNLDETDHQLTVVELPMLRIALETALKPFLIKNGQD